MPTRCAVVRAGLGLLLITAAGLKLYGLGVSAVPQVGWFAQSWVQLATAGWELGLGAWLLSGVAVRWSWLTALLTFAVFSAVSAYLGWIGVASCGCFGTIQASPWWAFGVDVAALAALVVSYPDSRAVGGAPNDAEWSHGFAGVLVGACLIFAVLSGITTWVYGSPTVALARLRGEPYHVPGYVDFGTARTGTSIEREIPIANLTDRPMRLVGGTSDCSCMTLSHFPVTIGPGETAVVPVRLKVPGSAAGAFTRWVEVWADDGQQVYQIRFTTGCKIE